MLYRKEWSRRMKSCVVIINNYLRIFFICITEFSNTFKTIPKYKKDGLIKIFRSISAFGIDC